MKTTMECCECIANQYFAISLRTNNALVVYYVQH